MTAVEDRPAQLAPVTVDCTWCESQFLSRARHMMPVHCPRCGHSIRVKRWAEIAQHAALTAAPAPTATGETRISPVAVDSGNLNGSQAVDEDEGDETYIYDELGRLVLAEWTEDGRLVAADRRSAIPQRPEITWADAITALRWRLEPVTSGCQIRTADGICGAEVTRHITGGWICGRHHFVLCSVITRKSA